MPRRLASAVRTHLALAVILASCSAQPSAADPWPDNGVKVMATNGAVYSLPGPSGQIRVIAQSALCTPSGSAGFAAGLMDTSGHVFSGNGTEVLLFCYPADGSSLSLGAPLQDGSGDVYSVLTRSASRCIKSIMGSSADPAGAQMIDAPSCQMANLAPQSSTTILGMWRSLDIAPNGEVNVQSFGPSGAVGAAVTVTIVPNPGYPSAGGAVSGTNGRGMAVVGWGSSQDTYLSWTGILKGIQYGQLLWSLNIVGPPSFIEPDSTGGTYVGVVPTPHTGNVYFVTRVGAGGGLYPGWSNFGVQMPSNPYTVVADGVGGLLYVHKPTGGGYYIRRVLPTAAEATAWNSLVPIPSSATNLKMCADGFGGAVVTWSATGNPGTGNDVYARHICADGSLSSPSAIPIAVAPGEQLVSSIRSDLAGNVYVCWTDTRDGTLQAYVGHLTVRPFGSQFAFTTEANPCLVAQPVTLTVNVHPQATGTVEFFERGALIGSVPVSQGVANLEYTPQDLGVRTLTARYSGDALYEPARDSIAVSVVNRLPTTTAITFSQTPGSGVGTLTATVTPGDPTGTITITIPGSDPVTLPVSGGNASIQVSVPTSGSGDVTAAYSGDALHFPSNTQAPLVFATVTTVDANTLDAYAGTLLQLAANITPAPTSGTVEILVDGHPRPGVPAAGGSVQFTPDSLPVGSHFLQARFLGAPFLGPSSSSELDVNILAAPANFLRVVSPNNGELWSIGTTHAIQWNATADPSTVSLYVSRNGGSSWKSIALDVPNTGSYTWMVNGPVADHRALIRVTDPTEVAVEDQSDLPFTIGAAVGAVPDALPDVLFAAAYPNPSPGPTSIRFALPSAAHVKLTVVDLMGREVAVLADGDYAAGRYDTTWNGGGRSGTVPAGLYFVRLAAGDRALVSRVAIVSGR